MQSDIAKFNKEVNKPEQLIRNFAKNIGIRPSQ